MRVRNKDGGKETMYKIEVLVKKQWRDDAVGSENRFETEQAARDMIPQLMKIYGDTDENEYRIVEIQ